MGNKIEKHTGKTTEYEVLSRRNAHQWEMIVPLNTHTWSAIGSMNVFNPMLVLNTYFLHDERYEMWQNGVVDDDDMFDLAYGYINAVGIDGYVYDMQWYDYDILKQGELSDEWKQTIMSMWECENITYRTGERLKRKRDRR